MLQILKTEEAASYEAALVQLGEGTTLQQVKYGRAADVLRGQYAKSAARECWHISNSTFPMCCSSAGLPKSTACQNASDWTSPSLCGMNACQHKHISGCTQAPGA